LKRIKILLVDDEENLLEASRLYLEKFSTHYQIQTANSAFKALEIIKDIPFDVIISDYQMPEIDGLEFLSRLRESGNTSSFIIFTGKGREEVAIQALNLGADFYLQKGGDAISQFRELTNLIDNLVEKKRTELARQKLLEQQISVNELALTLGETRDLNSVYKTIFQHIYSIMDADTFVVDFYNKEESSISPGYALIAGNTLDITEFPSIPLSSKECGNQAKVIDSNEIVYIPNLYQKNPIDTSTEENQANYFTDRMFTQSAVYVPMKIGGDTIGILQLQSYRLDAYTQDDINLLSTLANVAAVSIQNARFFDSQQQMTQTILDEKNIAQSYLDVVDSIVIVLDLDGNIQLINKQGCIKLQCKEQEILGTNWFENYLPEDIREQVFDKFIKVIKDERETFSVSENTVLSRDQQERLISWRTKVLKNEYGVVTGVLSSGQDLTRGSPSEASIQEQPHLDEISFLTNSAIEFIGLTADKSIYKHIGEKISGLIKDAIIITTSYNPNDESFLIESVQGIDTKYFDKIFNKKLVGAQISVEPRVTTFVSNNTIAKVPTSLFDMSNGFITQKEETAARKLLNITDYYIISFVKEGILLGSVIVILRNKAKIENIELIDAFASQVSVALLRSNAEEDLVESESKYRRLFDFSNDGIILYDLEMNIQDINEQALSYLGYEKLSADLKQVIDIIPPVNQKDFLKLNKKIRREGIRRTELVFIDRSNRIFPVEISANPIDYGDRKLIQLVFRDITEKVISEEVKNKHLNDLQILSNTAMDFVGLSSERDVYGYIGEKIRELVGDSVVIVATFDPQEDIFKVKNISGMSRQLRVVARILGTDPNSVEIPVNKKYIRLDTSGKIKTLNADLADLTDGKISKKQANLLIRLLRIGKVYSSSFVREEILFGSIIISMKKGVEIKNLNLAEAFISQASVALLRRKAEEELLESEERFKYLVETMNDGFAVDDEYGRLTYVNAKLCEMLGYPQEEIIGKHATDFLDEKNEQIYLQQSLTRELGRVNAYELIWTRKDGGNITAIVSPKSIFDVNDEYNGSFAVVTDISQRKRDEIKLKHQGLELEKQRDELDSFASTIAHDLRGKMQVISLYNALADTEYTTKIADNIDEMSDFIEDLLFLAKTGAILGELTDVNLNITVDDILSKIKSLAPELGTSIQKLPIVKGDSIKLTQVFENLLMNIAKHSEATQLSVFAEENEKMHKIIVRDNGKGIPQNKKEEIIQSWTTKKYSSFGMLIVVKIIEAHGGTVTLESEENKGTSIIFTLPKEEEKEE